LLYLLIEKQDLSYKSKILLFILYLPLIVFVPTKYGLSGFDISTCLSIEGPLALYYTYFVEAVMIITILTYSTHNIIKEKNKRWEVLNLSLGTILFLFAFAWGNIVGSFTEDWQSAQYGLFGMPIFAGFLVYSIVKFKTFNVKLLGTQALVVTLWILLAAVLFLRTIENVRIVISITLILFLIIGIFLVRSVRREVEQREKIEKLAKDLQLANEKLKELDQMKSEFLSLATHQIRSPLTAIKGYSSMLLEGDFGVLPPKAANSVQIVMKSCQNLINIVNDFLNISRIEQGRMVYEKSIFNIGELVTEVTNEIKPNIENAGLALNLNIKDGSEKINGDRNKIKQVVSNIIDNSIKYTLKGSIDVSTFKEGSKVKVVVKDTGVGIDPNEMDKLFAKFSRTKDANKTNVVGTGLGLYIAKKMTEAHNGDIKVASEGLGKGTTFTIELPRYN
jgi:signal transduction histidine kinase